MSSGRARPSDLFDFSPEEPGPASEGSRPRTVVVPSVALVSGATVPRISHSPALIGATVGAFRLEAVIGMGTFGVVYRALELDSNRWCAIKVLHGHLAATPEARARIKREVEVLMRVRHPNVVQVLGAGETAQGRPFVVTELVEAVPLVALGRLPEATVVQILAAAARGLAAAHAIGILHRDLKPANLLVPHDAPSEVRLIDFGLAQSWNAGSSDAFTRLTTAERPVGSLRYMAPELFMSPDAFSPASDLYALGVVGFEMLHGRSPFPEPVSEMIAAKLAARRVDVGPGELAGLIAGLLDPRPELRPLSADAAAETLSALHKQGRPPSAHVVRRWASWVGLALALSVAPALFRPGLPSGGSKNHTEDGVAERQRPADGRPAEARPPEADQPGVPAVSEAQEEGDVRPPAGSKQRRITARPHPSTVEPERAIEPTPKAALPTAPASNEAELGQAFEELSSLARKLEDVRAQAFERRYLELRRRLKSGAEADAAELHRDIAELRREIRDTAHESAGPGPVVVQPLP